MRLLLNKEVVLDWMSVIDALEDLKDQLKAKGIQFDNNEGYLQLIMRKIPSDIDTIRSYIGDVINDMTDSNYLMVLVDSKEKLINQLSNIVKLIKALIDKGSLRVGALMQILLGAEIDVELVSVPALIKVMANRLYMLPIRDDEEMSSNKIKINL